VLRSAQEAAEEAGACVQRIVAALLCSDADAAEPGLAAMDGAHAPADGAAGNEAAHERARMRAAAAPRLAAARDVASAWALGRVRRGRLRAAGAAGAPASPRAAPQR